MVRLDSGEQVELKIQDRFETMVWKPVLYPYIPIRKFISMDWIAPSV